MEYITSRCPYCKKVVSHSNSFTKYSVGCPLRVCQYCGKTYIDPNCHELALKPYKPLNRLKCAFAAIICGIVAGFFVFLILTLFTAFSNIDLEHLYTIIPVSVGVVYGMLDLSFRLKNMDIENLARKRAWDESDARLRNYEYASLLNNSGIDVPKRYLKNHI